MRDIIEMLFFLGGSLLVWAKIFSVTLGLGLITYMCYRLSQALVRT